jgi:hypothetical protein
MIRKNVISSNINSIGYDSATRLLEIEFNSGGVYQYLNVPENVYSGLMAASSHGQYFHRNIKSVYSYQKVS